MTEKELAEAAAPVAEPAWRSLARDARNAAFAGTAAATLAMIIGATPVSAVPLYWKISATAIIAAFCLFGAACIRAAMALSSMARAGEPVGAMPRAKMIGILVAAGAMAAFGVFIAMMGTIGMSRGRQLRRRGKVLLPPLGPGGAWAALPLESKVPAGIRDAVAARWRENGRTEHASVAAFARLTMDLIALGAPPDLIHSANLDARDEIRHAELCFSIAKALDGRDGGPGPFPEAQTARTLPSNRTLALAGLAVDSLIDGALHEGLSARVIAQLAKRCDEPAIRSLLLELAADEGRHAAHGWDVVKWCLAEGGAPVVHALRGAIAAIPEHHASDLPAEARGGGWEKFGIHGAALEEEQHQLALASLSARVEMMTRGAGLASARA